MSFSYSSARNTVKRIINRYGGAGSVVQKGSTGGYDSEGNAKADTSDTVIDGIITPVITFKTSDIDGETIKRGDGFVYFQSESEVSVDMQTTINSETFRVKAVDILSSIGDVKIYQRLHLRK